VIDILGLRLKKLRQSERLERPKGAQAELEESINRLVMTWNRV
jgi:hypothetical protein